MAEHEVDLAQHWQSFTDLKKVLLRNVSLLSVMMLPLTYQAICVEFFVEEQSPGACNSTDRCSYVFQYVTINGTKTRQTQINHSQINFENHGTFLVASHFTAMMLGSLILGVAADRFGRRCVLFFSLALVFFGSLLASFFGESLPAFVLLRILAAFGTGGALLTLFVLAAEYVNPGPRPVVLIVIWLASTLSCISFAGLSYVVTSRKILMLSITVPLPLMVLIYSIIPESPRWNLLYNVKALPKNPEIQDNESETLLHKFTGEEVTSSQKSRCGCVSWGCHGTNTHCLNFVRKKERICTLIVVGLSWFVLGMLSRALDTSSIQLLKNFYVNFVVRQLVNLVAFACSVFFVKCAGRRITTVIGMVFCGVMCILFAFASNAFLLSEKEAVRLVVQVAGRMFVVLSITSLYLYSIELFPTVVRCTALGLVVCNKYLGAALTPLIMNLQHTNPTLPLAVLGLFSILAAVPLRVFLPETKGSLTAETLEDTVVGRRGPFTDTWSPRIAMRKKVNVDNTLCEDSYETSQRSNSTIDMEESEDRFKDLRNSWEVSFDRASRTSKWEWLSYDDAKRKLPSLDIETSLQGESQLLDESDREKLRDSVPGNAWILLYSTYVHGISLKTLYHRLREIDAPVLLAIIDDQDYVFGAYSPVPPHVQHGFYGFGKSFFFTCKPRFKVYPNSGRNEYYLHCEMDSLAFGCSDGTFGLWLDSALYRGRSTACETFNSDVLASSEDFMVIGLEVWTFA